MVPTLAKGSPAAGTSELLVSAAKDSKAKTQGKGRAAPQARGPAGFTDGTNAPEDFGSGYASWGTVEDGEGNKLLLRLRYNVIQVLIEGVEQEVIA